MTDSCRSRFSRPPASVLDQCRNAAQYPLRNCLARHLAHQKITDCHGVAPRLLTALEAGERDLIVGALHKAEGNRMRAAESLGIARSSLYRKLKSFGITVTDS